MHVWKIQLSDMTAGGERMQGGLGCVARTERRGQVCSPSPAGPCGASGMSPNLKACPGSASLRAALAAAACVTKRTGGVVWADWRGAHNSKQARRRKAPQGARVQRTIHPPAGNGEAGPRAHDVRQADEVLLPVGAHIELVIQARVVVVHHDPVEEIGTANDVVDAPRRNRAAAFRGPLPGAIDEDLKDCPEVA